jgi:hypothetical protein
VAGIERLGALLLMRDRKDRSKRRGLGAFLWGTEGALLTEALIVVPVVTIFAVGILEFGVYPVGQRTLA